VLRIRKIDAKDEGTYECQRSGEPMVSNTVILTVIGHETKELHQSSASRMWLGKTEGEIKNTSTRVDEESEGNLMVPGICLGLVILCLLSLGTVRTCLNTQGDQGVRQLSFQRTRLNPLPGSKQITREQLSSQKNRQNNQQGTRQNIMEQHEKHIRGSSDMTSSYFWVFQTPASPLIIKNHNLAYPPLKMTSILDKDQPHCTYTPNTK